MTLNISTLRQGAEGGEVTALQALINIKMPAGESKIGIDGKFGPKTLGAVQDFQNRAGLAADGIVGPLTWEALIKA